MVNPTRRDFLSISGAAAAAFITGCSPRNSSETPKTPGLEAIASQPPTPDLQAKLREATERAVSLDKKVSSYSSQQSIDAAVTAWEEVYRIAESCSDYDTQVRALFNQGDNIQKAKPVDVDYGKIIRISEKAISILRDHGGEAKRYAHLKDDLCLRTAEAYAHFLGNEKDYVGMFRNYFEIILMQDSDVKGQALSGLVQSASYQRNAGTYFQKVLQLYTTKQQDIIKSQIATRANWLINTGVDTNISDGIRAIRIYGLHDLK